jgi:catechol 2,3-dioxygenase-like lactoylglutathione lyase family enzyme
MTTGAWALPGTGGVEIARSVIAAGAGRCHRRRRMDPRLPIRSLDYTVIFARQMAKMREFYGSTIGFPLHKELSPRWVEFQVGSSILALTERGGRFDDPLPPIGVLSLQLAFRVAPHEVDQCAATLAERGVAVASPPTDQPFGHRTLFFRDPDGNVLEIYAEITPMAHRS